MKYNLLPPFFKNVCMTFKETGQSGKSNCNLKIGKLLTSTDLGGLAAPLTWMKHQIIWPPLYVNGLNHKLIRFCSLSKCINFASKNAILHIHIFILLQIYQNRDKTWSIFSASRNNENQLKKSIWKHWHKKIVEYIIQ